MIQSNPTLANRIAELERQLSTAISNNQALVAQVEALKNALIGAVNTLTYENGEGERCVSFIECVDISEEVKPYLDVANAAPQHHLHQVRADAVRNFSSYVFATYQYDMANLTNEFADSILAGKG